MEPVQCCNCGFLAVRDFYTRALREVDETMREKWVPFVIPPKEADPCEQAPLCSALAVSLKSEVDTKSDGHVNKQTVIAVLRKPRLCNKFTQWVPGFTPKEHKEMMHEKYLQELAQEQKESERKWQEERRESDREHYAEEKQRQEAREDAREQREAEREKQHKKEDRRWQIASVCLAGILGIAGVVVGRFLISTSAPSPPIHIHYDKKPPEVKQDSDTKDN